MKEIEVAYELQETLKEAQHKLKELLLVKEEKVIDTYFYDPDKKSSKPFRNNMGECLRIRSINHQHSVIYKIDKFDEDGKWEASDKYEQQVDNIKDVLINFSNSNLKELVRLEKHRFEYSNENYIIFLEEIKDLGCFFEVDYKGNINKDVSEIKDEMKEFAKSFGLKIENTIKMGKPEMMLKKLGIHIK